jgi:hypothetical protein
MVLSDENRDLLCVAAGLMRTSYQVGTGISKDFIEVFGDPASTN